MRILKFLRKPAKAVDQRIDAGDTEQPPQRRLGRSDDRFAAAYLADATMPQTAVSPIWLAAGEFDVAPARARSTLR
jgi:hypothetical protein